MNWKILFLGVVTCGCCFSQVAGIGGGYGGPNILSRGSGSVGQQEGPDAGFRYFAGVSGIYDAGLTPVSVDTNGNLLEVNGLYGVEGHLGAFGNRRFRHGQLGLDYDGNYRHYNQNTYYNGSDHVLSLEGVYDLTRRVSLISRNSAGSVSRSINSVYGLNSSPDQLIGTPTSEIFDNRTYFLQTSESIQVQKTARLSFSAGGDGFFVRRRSKALVGLDGYGAHGDVAYRISRKSTISGAYTFFHFDYPRAFGEAEIHQLHLGFARILTKQWQLALVGGAFHVNTVGVTSVALDPVTAALFGQSTSVVAFNKINTKPLVNAMLAGHFKTHTISFSYSRQPSPGNGVYLASTVESGNASIGYTGIARWSFFASAGYSRLTSIGQALGAYSSAVGGGGVTFRLGRGLNATARFDARQAQIDQTRGYNRFGSRSMISLDYSPGSRPLSVWR